MPKSAETKTDPRPEISQTIRLRDGRRLGYAEFGIPAEKVLFYLHGHPGCRLEARFMDEAAKNAGVRLIGIDRPGLGLSDYKSGRNFLDWTDDLVELADSLRIDRFAVAGYSGGSPYALACAYRIPHRLTACGIISGVGKVSFLQAFLSKWLPWLLLPIARRFFFPNKSRAKKTLARFAQRRAKPDQISLIVPEVSEIMAESLVEAFRQGASGAAYDGMLLGSSWGFNLEEITFPNLYLWHGELDKEVPISRAREVAEKLSHCKATYFPNEGHISLIANHGNEIVKILVGNQ